jgi:hypothetical protein
MNLEELSKAADSAAFLRREVQGLFSQTTTIAEEFLLTDLLAKAAMLCDKLTQLRNEAERGAK